MTLTNGCIANWRLNDNADTNTVVDILGNHNGTYHGTGGADDYTSAHSVAGKINTALDFDGTQDYVEVADHTDFTPALAPFSVSAWVNMVDATDFMIASKGVFNTDAEWQFYGAGSDKLIFRCYDESVADCYIGRLYNTALTTYHNQWIHLVATYDGGTLSTGIKIYLNGTRIDDTTQQSNAGSFVAVENLTHAVWIGRYDTLYADGKIDDVMIFNRAISPEEVKRLYNSGHGTEILSEFDNKTYVERWNTSELPLRKKLEV